MEPYQKFVNDGDVSDKLNNVLINSAISSDMPVLPSSSNSSSNNRRESLQLNNAVRGSGNKHIVRLRTVETEADFFLKLLHVTSIRRLLWVQKAMTLVVFLSQVLLYAVVPPSYYMVVDYVGIGIWAPLLFFSVACGLSVIAIKRPSGCLIGSALGFQVVSAIFGLLLTLLSVISLIMHSERHQYSDSYYHRTAAGLVLCTFMTLASSTFVVTCVFICIQFCRATCCGLYKSTQGILFDVETVKA